MNGVYIDIIKVQGPLYILCRFNAKVVINYPLLQLVYYILFIILNKTYNNSITE